MQAVLLSNGPGELYTWVKPVLAELRRYPQVRIYTSASSPASLRAVRRNAHRRDLSARTASPRRATSRGL